MRSNTRPEAASRSGPAATDEPRQPDPGRPGYKHIRFEPRPGGTLTHAAAALETILAEYRPFIAYAANL